MPVLSAEWVRLRHHVTSHTACEPERRCAWPTGKLGPVPCLRDLAPSSPPVKLSPSEHTGHWCAGLATARRHLLLRLRPGGLGVPALSMAWVWLRRVSLSSGAPGRLASWGLLPPSRAAWQSASLPACNHLKLQSGLRVRRRSRACVPDFVPCIVRVHTRGDRQGRLGQWVMPAGSHAPAAAGAGSVSVSPTVRKARPSGLQGKRPAVLAAGTPDKALDGAPRVCNGAARGLGGGRGALRMLGRGQVTGPCSSCAAGWPRGWAAWG